MFTKSGILKARHIKISLNEFAQGIIISAAVIAVYHYWFAIADRNYLFLYEHFGWGPFHHITSGRYWMTGLILSSFITLFYIIYNFTIIPKNLIPGKNYQLPLWIHVWLVSQPALIAGIPLIVMNFNTPVIPAGITIICVLVMSVGLALGLYMSDIFLHDVKKFFVLCIDGILLVPPLTLILALELPAKGVLNMTDAIAIVIALGSVIISFIGLLITAYIFKRNKITPGKSYEILFAGLFIAYLLMPMAHFLFATSQGRPYITSSDNFFPDNNLLKIFTWLTAAVITSAIVKFRKKILIKK
jgi:hypothetical protein